MNGPTLTSRITFEHLRALETDQSRGFWEDVDIRPDACDCWEWKRAATNDYGRVNVPGYITGLGRSVMLHAHRVALALHLGHLLPAGLVVDHVCGNGLCCNPSHLELVTQRVNTQRARRTIEEIRAPRFGLAPDRLIVHRVLVHPEPPPYTHSLPHPLRQTGL